MKYRKSQEYRVYTDKMETTVTLPQMLLLTGHPTQHCCLEQRTTKTEITYKHSFLHKS